MGAVISDGPAVNAAVLPLIPRPPRVSGDVRRSGRCPSVLGRTSDQLLCRLAAWRPPQPPPGAGANTQAEVLRAVLPARRRRRPPGRAGQVTGETGCSN